MLTETLATAVASDPTQDLRSVLYANAALMAMHASAVGGPDHDDDLSGEGARGKRKHDKRTSSGSRGTTVSSKDKDKDACRNQTGYIGVRQRKWGMFAAEIRDGDKRRWLGSFGTSREAGLAYDAAAVSQKGCKAKTNFQYEDFVSVPRHGAEKVDVVRWDLLPKEIAERFPVPTNPGGLQGQANDLDAVPSSLARSRARGVDQQVSIPDAPQDQQPSKRSRSSSYGNGGDAGHHSAASYPPRYAPGGYEDHHVMAAGYYPMPGMWRHPDDLEDHEYAAAAAYPHPYMMGPPTMMHPMPGGYDMPPQYRDGPNSRKRSSGGMSGAGAGSSSSPRGGVPPGPSARVVASAASRAAAVAAFEGMNNPGHPYAMNYAMPYPPPKSYRVASGRGCSGSEGGIRAASGGGSRQHSDARRSSEEAGTVVAVRRQRPSDDSLPLASLELEGSHAGPLDGAQLHDGGMEPHPMMLHYADVGPYPGYELHPMMAHPGSRYHPGPYAIDPHGPRNSQAGAEAMHHAPMSQYDGGMVPMPGFVPGYHHHPHPAMAYGYPPMKEEDCVDPDGDDTEDLAARWKDLTRSTQGHAGVPRSVDEMDMIASLQHISMPGGPPGSMGMDGQRGHALQGANAAAAAAVQQQRQQRRQTSEVGDSAHVVDMPPMSDPKSDQA